VEFAPSAPRELAEGISSGSSAIPESARNQLRSQRDEIARQLQNPNTRLIIVGYADKCFEGPPFLGNQYNKDLSRRRADAMLDLVREVMGTELSGVELRTVAMGRRCANPKCRCSTPDMPECASDRRVDLIIDQGEIDEIQCQAGEYWLAR
jgi:outer membrane protein OmpA-like peptidoglycan-associated protein